MSKGAQDINGEIVEYGFSDLLDWLTSVVFSFQAPWSLAPLEGKYYGTEILDARGIPILRLWDTRGEPSTREKESFENWTQEAWNDYVCDTHWECQLTLDLASHIIHSRNVLKETHLWKEEENRNQLALLLIQSRVGWADEVWEEIACGGPYRRNLHPQWLPGQSQTRG